MSEQLKPYPFCNRVEYEIRASESSFNVHIMCNCRRFSTMWHQSVDACVAEWNTRPREDALQAKIDALEALAKKADAVILWVKDGVHSGNAVRFVHTVDNYETARAKLNEVKRHE